MERVAGDQVIKKESRTTYDLSEEELVAIIKKVGFGEVKK